MCNTDPAKTAWYANTSTVASNPLLPAPPLRATHHHYDHSCTTTSRHYRDSRTLVIMLQPATGTHRSTGAPDHRSTGPRTLELLPTRVWAAFAQDQQPGPAARPPAHQTSQTSSKTSSQTSSQDQQPPPRPTWQVNLPGQPARSTCQVNLADHPDPVVPGIHIYIYIYIFGTRYCPSPECSIQIKPHDGKLSEKISVAAGFHSSRARILGGARRRNSERA